MRSACALVVVVYGCWTLLANLMVLSGKSFDSLSRWAFLAIPAAAAILVFIRFDRPPTDAGVPDANTVEPDEHNDQKILQHLLIGAALAAVFAFFGSFVIFWVLTALYLGVMYWRGRGSAPLKSLAPNPGGFNYSAFAAAALIALLAALLLNRPNPDQTLPLHMAVSVMDQPMSAMFATDTLHGIPGAYYLPTYRVHSFELLAALIARAFNISEPIVVFHLMLAPFFALFSTCAAAVCMQRLSPRWWGWATLMLIAALLILRGTYTMYGNFAFLRMFEGKSVFITAMVPLIVIYAVDFFTRPRPGSWLLLMLAQVCAVGFTANALYAGPLAAGLALAACWRPAWPATRRLGLGLLASVYPVALALFIRAIMIRDGLLLEEFQKFIPIDAATKLVLGEGATLWLWLQGLTGAWCLVKDRGIRQWVLGFSLAFLLICMNPFLDEYWGAYVTAKYLTWRLLWVIPLPIFLTLFVTQGLAIGFDRAPGRRLIPVFILLALVLTLTIGKPWIDPFLEPELRIGLKVPEKDYEIAGRLNEIAGKGNLVLAPENISAWVPTFRDHAYVVVARIHIAEGVKAVFRNRIDRQDIRQRLALQTYMNGASADNPRSENLLMRWLEQDKISAIALPGNFERIAEVSKILDQAGFVATHYQGYIIFHNQPPGLMVLRSAHRLRESVECITAREGTFPCPTYISSALRFLN